MANYRMSLWSRLANCSTDINETGQEGRATDISGSMRRLPCMLHIHCCASSSGIQWAEQLHWLTNPSGWKYDTLQKVSINAWQDAVDYRHLQKWSLHETVRPVAMSLLVSWNVFPRLSNVCQVVWPNCPRDWVTLTLHCLLRVSNVL